jgi:hypothetical protein
MSPLTPPSFLDTYAALLLKSGVLLGSLSEPERQCCFAVAAARLPLGASATEAAANQHLKQALGEELAFVDVDHVELRRWLCDMGWWRRDGYGRAYERVAPGELPAEKAALHDAVAASGDLAAFAAARRAAAAAAKKAKREAWLARQG